MLIGPTNLTLNSNAVVVDAGGTTLTAGTYRVLDYSGSRSGSFLASPTIVNGSVAGPATIGLSRTNQVNLIVGSGLATPPQVVSMELSSSNLITTGVGGSANGLYYVLSATNLTLSPTTWPRIATNAFDGSGNFTFTNSIASDDSNRFYVVLIP